MNANAMYVADIPQSRCYFRRHAVTSAILLITYSRGAHTRSERHPRNGYKNNASRRVVDVKKTRS